MLGWDNFESFTEALKRAATLELPGVEAQFKLLPPGRKRPDFKEIISNNPKKAGVLALFYPRNNQPYLVLMKRNSYPGVHSDQISLPGGQLEDLDVDLVETALRETEEEIGIQRSQINVVGKLTQVFIPPSNYLVQPVIGTSFHDLSFSPNPTEVQALIETPFAEFLNKKNFITTKLMVRGIEMEVPAYHINNEIIWGATAMMIAELVHMFQH